VAAGDVSGRIDPLLVFFAKLFARARLYPRVAAGDVSGRIDPLLVFFAKLSFFQKKAEGFILIQLQKGVVLND